MPEWIKYFTFSAAMIGAILGIINTWKSINRDKIKLKVIPEESTGHGHFLDSVFGLIEVVNLSSFDITLVGIGLLSSNNQRLFIAGSLSEKDKGLPIRLKSKDSAILHFTRNDIKTIDNGIKCAFACTASGETFFGNSPALKQIFKYLQQEKKEFIEKFIKIRDNVIKPIFERIKAKMDCEEYKVYINTIASSWDADNAEQLISFTLKLSIKRKDLALPNITFICDSQNLAITRYKSVYSPGLDTYYYLESEENFTLKEMTGELVENELVNWLDEFMKTVFPYIKNYS